MEHFRPLSLSFSNHELHHDGSDDHDVGLLRSLSSDEEPIKRQFTGIRQLTTRFADPVDLYDGNESDDYPGREDRHISQGFLMYGDRINFARANHCRVLVTGGAGFIGSHLVKKLLETGNSVVVLDNFLTGSMRNLEECEGHPSLLILNHDILNPLPKRLIGVDEIYHLACPSSPFFWQTNLINMFSIIVEGTKNVLDFAQRSGAKVLYASTTEVYGDPEPGVGVQSEAYRGSVDCFTERACHDEAKRAAETLCYAYQTERKVKVRIARIGSTYGPRMGVCDGSMISSFASALIDGVEIHVASSTSEATRTIMYVDDCINGLIKLMKSSFFGPINIAGDDVMSVKDLQRHLEDLVANPSNALPWKAVTFFPESGSRRPANATAFVNLAWYPEVKAREGLKKTVNWFKEEKARRLLNRAKVDEARILANMERDELEKRRIADLAAERESLLPLSRLFTTGFEALTSSGKDGKRKCMASNASPTRSID